MLNSDVVIVSACRTPIGKLRGQLASVRPDDLLAHVFRAAQARSGIDANEIDEVFAGCANQAGEDNRNVARMASLLAGFSFALPGVTVNRLCASGLEALLQGTRSIRVGDHQVVLCGGTESMTRAPWAMMKPDQAYPSGVPTTYDTALGWRFENPKMRQLFPLESMGQTAENVALKFGISRARQDEWALRSHQNAVVAQKSGWFDCEIEPVEVRVGKSLVQVAQDEGPRTDTSLERLSLLKPAFCETGSVTAGNSSTLNDGAAALMLCSRDYATAHGLPVKARILSYASAGVDPSFMGMGPVAATQKALAKAGLSVTDLDAIELNEAFAAQVLAVSDQLGLDLARVNCFGGAIALGHPLGCSGARIVTTLLSVLERQKGTLGLASMCVGVGQGVSLVLERVA